MLPPRGWAAALAAVAALSLLPVASAAGTGGGGGGGTIVGADGKTYPSAPPVLVGRHGDLFLGIDFDLFCGDGASPMTKGLHRLAHLARLIQRSGKRVVLTVAPNKALIDRANLSTSQLPQGRCDSDSMTDQRRLITGFPDPTYLSMMPALTADHRQVWWKTDTHWTLVGASDWARTLATRLDPRLGRAQRYRIGTQTRVGFMSQVVGSGTPETAPAAFPDNGVRVRTDPDSVFSWDPADGQLAFDYSWNSFPAHKTWPGHTLLIGDSFTLMGLPDLRPLFRHGRYQWIGNVAATTMADAIASSDTVVIEVAQLFVPGNPLGQDSFRRLVRHTLAHRTS